MNFLCYIRRSMRPRAFSVEDKAVEYPETVSEMWEPGLQVGGLRIKKVNGTEYDAGVFRVGIL